jgi:hypothetical protein
MQSQAFYDMVDEVEQELANYQRVTEHSNTGYSNGTSEEVKTFIFSLADANKMQSVIEQISQNVVRMS